MVFYLSAWEHDPEMVIEGNVIVRDQSKEDLDGRMSEIFERLYESVDAIPSATVAKTEELYAVLGPDKYEEIAGNAIESVSVMSFPKSATEFLETLNLTLLFSR